MTDSQGSKDDRSASGQDDRIDMERFRRRQLSVRAKAANHPIRRAALKTMATEGAGLSPTAFARRSGETVAAATYHFRVLEELEAVKITDEVPRRGAIEHFYSITLLGREVVVQFGL